MGYAFQSVCIYSWPAEDQHKDEYEGLHYEPEMRDLMNEVGVKLASKWRDIGRELKLEEWQLDNIGFTHRNDPGTNSAISEVFCVWQASKYIIITIIIYYVCKYGLKKQLSTYKVLASNVTAPI